MTFTNTPCFHCQTIVTNDAYPITYQGNKYYTCSSNCQSVVQSLCQSKLDAFYQFRTSPSQKLEAPPEFYLNQLDHFQTNATMPQEASFPHPKSLCETNLLIEGMRCAACSWLIEKRLQNLLGVEKISVNITTHTARVVWNKTEVSLRDIAKAIYEVGYKAFPYSIPSRQQSLYKERNNALKRLGVSGLGMMQVMMFSAALYFGVFQGMDRSLIEFIRWVSLIVTTPILWYAGKPFYQSTWGALKVKTLNMDVPITIALSAAYIASLYMTLTHGQEVYFDSISMFLFFLSVSRYLELRARYHATATLVPESPANQFATIEENGIRHTISIHQLKPNDKVIIKPGETIVADGVVLEGKSAVSEALLTGEPFPKFKLKGDTLIGGTQNIDAPLVMQVTNVGPKTVFSQIVRLLEKAQSEKPPIVKLADFVARYFVGGVLILAVLTAIYWSITLPERAFQITLSVLVVTCPCALSLATPTAITAAMHKLRRLGVLITRGHVLEGLNHCTDIIFDKTGTLTEGRMQVAKIEFLDQKNAKTHLQVAEALECYSNHPIAKAIVERGSDNSHPITLSDVTSRTNRGVEGTFQQNIYRIGKSDFVSELIGSTLSPPDITHQWVVLGDKTGALIWFQLIDPIKQEAAQLLKWLSDKGFTLHLLTGDPSQAALQLGKDLGFQNIMHNASPQDKIDYVRALQKAGKTTVMVGDGLNDAPVLSQAHVSIAMDQGADFTKYQADCILMGGRLSPLQEAIHMAHMTKRIITQNLAWAILYNLSAVPLAMMGFVPPYIAALGMSLSSLLVVFNALRLHRVRLNQASSSQNVLQTKCNEASLL